MYIVVDAAYEIYRAHHAFKHFVNSKGFHNGALFGFLRSINSLRKKYPGTFVVAWEGRPKSRIAVSSEYKSDREGLPDEVRLQLKPLQDILRAMGVMQVQAEDWEADDLLATMACKMHHLGEQVVIVTGDDDLLQCVDDNETNPIMVYNPRYKILYHEKEVMEKYKVAPKRLVDAWAIQGDESDCIHGTKGLGDAFSVDMITRFGGLEDIFKHIDQVMDADSDALINKKIDRLKGNREEVFKNKTLLTLNTDVPDMIIDEPRKDLARLESLFRELELNSFAGKMEEWDKFTD